jgi:hypothetical protein
MVSAAKFAVIKDEELSPQPAKSFCPNWLLSNDILQRQLNSCGAGNQYKGNLKPGQGFFRGIKRRGSGIMA